jgi:ABC-type protease/lipase transport system fused ATPase/permease subunit
MGLAEASRRNAEAVQAIGMAAGWLSGGMTTTSASRPATRGRHCRRHVHSVAYTAHDPAVGGAGDRRLAGDQPAGHRRHHHRDSILTARALAPVEVALSQWCSFIAARQSWRRLNGLLARILAEQARMKLPTPSATLALDAVGISPLGAQRIVIQGIAFQLKAGLGRDRAERVGQSSLVRAIVGDPRQRTGRRCYPPPRLVHRMKSLLMFTEMCCVTVVSPSASATAKLKSRRASIVPLVDCTNPMSTIFRTS